MARQKRSDDWGFPRWRLGRGPIADLAATFAVAQAHLGRRCGPCRRRSASGETPNRPISSAEPCESLLSVIARSKATKQSSCSICDCFAPLAMTEQRQRACKPGFVRRASRKRDCAAIPLGTVLPRPPPATNPGVEPEPGPCDAPIRSCTRWGLPCRHCCQSRGALLPHPFDLTRPKPGRCPFCSYTVPEPPSPKLVRPAGRYPAPWFHGARTFLAGSELPPRPPGPLARRDIGQMALLLRVKSVMAGMGGKRTLATRRE